MPYQKEIAAMNSFLSFIRRKPGMNRSVSGWIDGCIV